MKVKLKVCGMRYSKNISDVAKLQPDYLGFIFYENSRRNFEGEIPVISNKIIKTGVFVNADYSFIIKKINKYNLKAIQLHGEESAEFCRNIRKEIEDVTVEIIKVFSIGSDFDFSILKEYETVCNYFLFDTKGIKRGGNGITFNWKILKNYPSNKPYFLSGGIGLEEVGNIKKFVQSKASKYCYAIDVNSKFEDKPGLKNIENLKLFRIVQ